MSVSIQGVLVAAEQLRGWVPDHAVQANIEAQLKQVTIDNVLDERDRQEFLSRGLQALGFVAGRLEHPGQTWEGAHVTWRLLQSIGKPVFSNTFNPIGWSGITRMQQALAAGGSPVQIGSSNVRSGPWQLADSDATFFGGWDRVTQRSTASVIRQTEQIPELQPLRELGRWLNEAIEADLTLWAWIS